MYEINIFSLSAEKTFSPLQLMGPFMEFAQGASGTVGPAQLTRQVMLGFRAWRRELLCPRLCQAIVARFTTVLKRKGESYVL
jgi:hypothetical protein